MILFNREVLFVHNPKTAGTSLLACLESILPDVQKAGTPQIGTHHPHLSRALAYACDATGNSPEDFKRILVGVRDPVARERSMYAYFRVIADLPGTGAELNDPELEAIVKMAARCDFDTYIRFLFYGRGVDVWRSRFYYRTDDGRAPAALRLLRLPTLLRDLAAALHGVEHNPIDAIPHANRSESGSVTLDDRTRTMIENSYAWMRKDGISTH